ncbi:MAG: PIG-L deacetylase family protein [Marmoricola sp.]
MSTRPAVILSPHLDDAVLSCWHLLSGPGDVAVINVFAGSPPAGSGTSWWDRISGATDSAVRMEERRAEDGEAFAIAGRSATHLDFLDEQYEPADQSVERLVSTLRDLIDADTVVYAPAALGEHGDHEKVRAAALELAASGHTVRLYADHPHSVRRGWPAWIDGTDSTAGREVAEHWDQRLSEAGLASAPPALHHLDAAEQQRKLRAVSAYRTQIAALKASFGELDGFPAFPLEIVWAVR